MGLDDTGDLEVSLQRTRASLGNIIRDYEKSPYLDIEDWLNEHERNTKKKS